MCTMRSTAGGSLEALARAEGLDPARIVEPADAGPESWNGALAATPSLVVQCFSTADVRAALRIAHALELGLSVFSGGNDWAGRSIRDQGLAIDISRLDAITVDAARRTARFGGGVQSAAFSRSCEEAGSSTWQVCCWEVGTVPSTAGSASRATTSSPPNSSMRTAGCSTSMPSPTPIRCGHCTAAVATSAC
jgi:hypothetical protein